MGAGLVLALLVCRGTPAAAQGMPVERTYAHSQEAVEKALDQMRATARGRLPTLDGFVAAMDQPVDKYSSPYFDCTTKLSPGSPGGTVVRVTAKITAWYTDSNPAKSGYRTLPSNGRLESDFLDRLGEILDPGSSPGGTAPTPGQSSLPSSHSPSDTVRLPNPNTALPGRAMPGGVSLTPLPATGGAGRDSAAGSGAAPSGDTAATEAQRAETEQHASELHTLALNLEEILRNQAHPENLAAVRRSDTPVFSKPLSSAQVLFTAEAQDEFQILDVQANWVHVQISGPSRGWMRRADLEMPEGFAAKADTGVNPNPLGVASFRMTRETVSRFPGDWQPLRGKTVKVYYVEPAGGMTTSGKEKLEFAKSLLTSKEPDATPGADTAEGVVVVFDSADGGQISATLADLKEFREGRISEVVFWHRCSLDPREAFEEEEKPE